MNKKLSILVICGMLIYFGIGLLTSKAFYHLVLKNMDLKEHWNETLLEILKLFSTMKHLNETEYRLEEIENTFCETNKATRKMERKALWYQFFRTNFLEVLFFLITTYGILLIGKKELTILDFITFQSLYIYFITPIKELTDIGPKLFYLKGVLGKISETMHWKTEELSSKKEVVTNPNILVKNLTYSYNKMENIFKNVTFEITAKEHIFLDGKSGCGKSTFCKILHRDLEKYEGEILISSKNLKDYQLNQIRSSIIYLSQHESLLTATIKENILFGSMENKRFEEIIKICEIESIVFKRPFRYETKVNNETLSGGERQRIMLARTLMKEGSIYIFDECLSEVEKKLEIKIIKKVREFLKDTIIIYISHTDNSKYFERRINFENTNDLE